MNRLMRGLLAAETAAPMVAVPLVSTAPQAAAENHGVGAASALSWSRWSFLRHNSTSSTIEAQADAMRSGLGDVGDQYVDLDDWYQLPWQAMPECPPVRTPGDPTPPGSASWGSENSIQVAAGHVHAYGFSSAYMSRLVSRSRRWRRTRRFSAPAITRTISRPQQVTAGGCEPALHP
jgi:hypothetical protein